LVPEVKHSSNFVKGIRMIKGFYKVSHALREEIDALLLACVEYDGLKTDIFTDESMNLHKDMQCAYTFRHQDKLTGFMFVFAPSAAEIEVSAIVHPDFRRQGVFKALLAEVLEEGMRFQYKCGLLVCDADSPQGKQVMAHWKLSIHHTEYQMQHTVKKGRPVPEGYILDKASIAELDALSLLGTQIFKSRGESEADILRNSIESPGRIQWVFKKQDKFIGLCAAELIEDKCFIYGLGIHPEERRKGYARIILDMAANHALENGIHTLCLDVDSNNPAALTLYRSYGFIDVSVTDYYSFRLYEWCESLNG
jgi:ribosomal protein S18 acetylase RimI-like enzyme